MLKVPPLGACLSGRSFILIFNLESTEEEEKKHHAEARWEKNRSLVYVKCQNFLLNFYCRLPQANIAQFLQYLNETIGALFNFVITFAQELPKYWFIITSALIEEAS